MTDDIEDKYLDPAQNPFIMPEEDKTPALKPEDPRFDSALLAPMVDLTAMTPEGLSEKLAAAFPGQDEVTVGQTTFVKMTDGSFTEKKSGKALEELPMADLLALNEFLQNRRKG